MPDSAPDSALTTPFRIFSQLRALLFDNIPEVHKSQAPGRHGVRFCTVAPNIGGSSVWHLLYVILLAPRGPTWLLDFCQICEPRARHKMRHYSLLNKA